MSEPVYKNAVEFLADIRNVMTDARIKRVTIRATDGELIFDGLATECNVITKEDKRAGLPDGPVGFEVVLRFKGTGEPSLVKHPPRPSASGD